MRYLIILFIILSACEPDITCDPVNSINSIVNGTKTERTIFQQVVRIVVNKGSCSGVLIGPHTVLTAAHCIGTPYDIDALHHPNAVVTVYNDLSCGDSIQEIDVLRVMYHEDAHSLNRVDLAIMILEEDVEDVEPFDINEEFFLRPGTTGVIVGYGRTEDKPSGDVSRWAPVEVLHSPDGKANVGGSSNSCSGDSGGPFLILDNNEWLVAGIISYREAPCISTKDGVWTTIVRQHADWIAMYM